MKRLNDESGSALVEYTVLAGLLVITVIAAISIIGGIVMRQWDMVEDALTRLH